MRRDSLRIREQIRLAAVERDVRIASTYPRITGKRMHLAYFQAPWCGVCHEKAPVVEQIASDVRLDLARWDIEQADGRAEAELRRIKTVPTLALVHGERVPFRLVGRMITPENVRHLLAQFAPGTDGPR